MSWDSDIEDWAQRHQRSPETVSAICIRKGWEPDKYHSAMKRQLFDWLDLWYTLSVKKLPTPATSLKRNPNHIAKKCPVCSQKIIFLRRIGDGMMLGSCGDSFHDPQCKCSLCNSFDTMSSW